MRKLAFGLLVFTGLAMVVPFAFGRTYYYNVNHVPVKSPTYYPMIPAGATAQCRDGTYSFSLHRSGTCSGNGSVTRWLR